MRPANRTLAVALLFMAVLCSPAGVCVVDGVVASVQAATPEHVHACCKKVERTVLTASDSSCCTEPRNGFVNVFRFTLQKQVAHPSLIVAKDWTARTIVIDVSGFGRAASPVLRI